MTVPIAVRSQWDQPNSPKESSPASMPMPTPRVAAGETQTFNLIMRGMSGETERRRYRNVGALRKTDPPHVPFVSFGAGLVDPFPILFWEWSSFGLRPKVRESPLSLAVAGD
jgi:hypothetical protein